MATDNHTYYDSTMGTKGTASHLVNSYLSKQNQATSKGQLEFLSKYGINPTYSKRDRQDVANNAINSLDSNPELANRILRDIGLGSAEDVNAFRNIQTTPGSGVTAEMRANDPTAAAAQYAKIDPPVSPLAVPTKETVGQGINLISGGNLQVGSSSEQVKQLQTLLGITADGKYGPLTQAAVKKFQAANGLVVDGIVGPKTNAALTKIAPPTTSSGVITPGNLTSPDKIVVPPIMPGTDSATPFVAGIQTAYDSSLKEAEAAQTKAQGEADSMSKTIEGLLGQSAGQGQALLDAEKAAGVAEKQAAVDEVNSQIQTKLAEYNALNTDAQGKAVTMNSIIGAQAQIRNVKAAEIGLLQAQADALQGKLTRAKDAADKAVELKYADIKTELDIRVEQLKLIQDTLTDKEKITADLLERQYDAQKLALSTQISNDKDKNATLLNQMQAYPDAGITMQDTLESANAKITSRSKIYQDKIRGPVGSGGSASGPLSILDIARYQEIYPDAGIIAGDTEATANRKVNAGNSPEAQALSIIQAAKDKGATYKEIAASLADDPASLAIAKKIYGITDTTTPTTTSTQKTAFNPSTGKIESSFVNPLTGGTSTVKSNQDYLIQGISNSLFK